MVAVPEFGISDISFLAGESMASNYQYHFVELQSAGYVHKADSGSATYAPIGVLQNNPASGEDAAVCVIGATKLVIDSTGASYGAWLTCDGSGRGSATTTASLVCAVALADSDTSASSIIPVLLCPGRSHLATKA